MNVVAIGHAAAADVDRVPTISAFYGIVIRMHWRDHAPPHFHAEYGEYEVTIDLESSKVLDGELPRTALNLVLQWATTNRELLRENWALCANRMPPKKIPPLD